MQATGLSEDGRVAIRQRWVWCVRSWWKKVGRKAGKEGASSAWRMMIKRLEDAVVAGDIRIVRGHFGCRLR